MSLGAVFGAALCVVPPDARCGVEESGPPRRPHKPESRWIEASRRNSNSLRFPSVPFAASLQPDPRRVPDMAKSVHNDVLDGAFNILNDADIMTACSAEPTTRTEAVTTYALADVAMTPGTDFTNADDAVSPYGRKCTVAAKSAVPVDTTGTAIYVALCDATRLLYATTCTSQLLTSGNTVNFPAWKVQIGDPT